VKLKNETNSHKHFRILFAFSRVSGGFKISSKILAVVRRSKKGAAFASYFFPIKNSTPVCAVRGTR